MAAVLGLLYGLAALGAMLVAGRRRGASPGPPRPGPRGLWLLAGSAAGRVSRHYPGLTVAPDLSWLLRREYLLALVAVGLAVGVLHVFRLRRRHARATRLQRPDASPRL